MVEGLAALPRQQRRAMLRQLDRDNEAYPAHLIAVDTHTVLRPPGLLRLLRSRRFMVQVYAAPSPVVARLTVNRTEVDESTWRWAEGVTWDELQRLKAEAGYADMEAVEIYPRARDLVNVAAMRHLWVLPEPMPFSWRDGVQS